MLWPISPSYLDNKRYSSSILVSPLKPLEYLQIYLEAKPINSYFNLEGISTINKANFDISNLILPASSCLTRIPNPIANKILLKLLNKVSRFLFF